MCYYKVGAAEEKCFKKKKSGCWNSLLLLLDQPGKDRGVHATHFSVPRSSAPALTLCLAHLNNNSQYFCRAKHTWGSAPSELCGIIARSSEAVLPSPPLYGRGT